MKAAGLGTRPAGYAAHHIVQWNDQRADAARQLLQRYGIDINAAVNGVYLPHTKAAAAQTEAQYHPAMHTSDYMTNITDALERAESRGETFEEKKQEITNELNRIAEELQKGEFPIRNPK